MHWQYRLRGNGQEAITADEIQLKYTSDGSVNKLLPNRIVLAGF